MIFSQSHDLKLRKNYNKIEKFYKIKKFVTINLYNKVNAYSKKKKRAVLTFLLLKYNRNNSRKTKIVRRCTITNRSRRVLRLYNISQMYFRHLTQFGLIPGCKKAAW